MLSHSWPGLSEARRRGEEGVTHNPEQVLISRYIIAGQKALYFPSHMIETLSSKTLLSVKNAVTAALPAIPAVQNTAGSTINFTVVLLSCL